MDQALHMHANTQMLKGEGHYAMVVLTLANPTVYSHNKALD